MDREREREENSAEACVRGATKGAVSNAAGNNLQLLDDGVPSDSGKFMHPREEAAYIEGGSGWPGREGKGRRGLGKCNYSTMQFSW